MGCVPANDFFVDAHDLGRSGPYLYAGEYFVETHDLAPPPDAVVPRGFVVLEQILMDHLVQQNTVIGDELLVNARNIDGDSAPFAIRVIRAERKTAPERQRIGDNQGHRLEAAAKIAIVVESPHMRGSCA